MFFRFSKNYAVWDTIFIIVIGCYTLFGLWGVSLLSCDGLKISSDLCCYVQNMAGELHRELFSFDPLLAVPTTANSIISLESTLASLLQPGDDIVQGMLRAGAVGVFFHYIACYYLGRRLFDTSLIAALFALLTGVTVWVSFGTYWGFGSGDITPRVFYAALFPALLAATLSALDKPQLRPLIMFVSGCGMYLHSISSLVASCMLFTVFLFHRAKGDSLLRHGAWLLLSLVAWCLPTLLYLTSSIKSATPFSPQDLAVLQQVFDRRFLEDEGGLWSRLIGHLHYRSDSFFLILGGIAGFFVVRRYGTALMKRLASIVPTLLLGLCLALLFSVAETHIAQALGRMPMACQYARLQPVGCAQGFRNGRQIAISLENNSRITLLEGILQTLPAVDARYDAQGLAVFAQNGAGAGSCRLKRRDAGNDLHRQMRRAFAKGAHAAPAQNQGQYLQGCHPQYRHQPSGRLCQLWRGQERIPPD